MSFIERYSQLERHEKGTLKKAGCLVLVLFLLLVSCIKQTIDATFAPDTAPTVSESSAWSPLPSSEQSPAVGASVTPTASASAKPAVTRKPPKPALPLVDFDVVATASCPDVGCLTVAVHANVTCKTITVSADVYDENDEWIDTVEQSFRGLAKGSTRKFTLTDGDYEDWQFELSDVLCG